MVGQVARSPLLKPLCALQISKSVPHSSQFYRDEWVFGTGSLQRITVLRRTIGTVNP